LILNEISLVDVVSNLLVLMDPCLIKSEVLVISTSYILKCFLMAARIELVCSDWVCF
jgi:hypothetical protein